jgi:nitrogen regulatory protein P-II 1
MPKVRIEMVVADKAEAERVVNVVAAAARTGKIGDGKVWVTEVEWLVRIRTGEMDGDAI